MADTRRPDAVLLLPDGVQLTLFRNVGVIMKDKTEIRGDWMVGLETGHRIVVWFHKRDGEQVVEEIYDKHMWEHGEYSDVPRSEAAGYVFSSVDDKREEEKYLRWYGAFPVQAL
jgi:hypothetical protein